MADQEEQGINEQGVITRGRFAGQHVSALAQYAENLETQLSSDTKTEAPKPEATPQERLATHSKDRLSSVADAATQRLELDDEAEFKTELQDLGVDYSKDWKSKIDIIKNGMNEQMRVSKGVHKLIYTQLRTQEPEAFAKLHSSQEAESIEAEELVEEETPQAVAEEIKEQSKAVPKAKAVVGGVSPTPGSRTAAAGKKEQKIPLQATAKVERLASEWGMSSEEYLKRIYARGVTQDDIERESVTRAERPGRMKSVFDRNTAT
tara:strand:+ start:191 stop:979 length:789 start_codon:yes stop_codon:yes gene_type:complete